MAAIKSCNSPIVSFENLILKSKSAENGRTVAAKSLSIRKRSGHDNIPVSRLRKLNGLAIELLVWVTNYLRVTILDLQMSLQCVPQHAFLHILAYIGRPHDFMQMLVVSKSWRNRFDESDVDLWYTISIEYDITVNKPSLGRSLRSTTDHRRVFFQTYFKKQREMDERHELLIVQAKSILEGARDQPAKLAKLIEKCFPNPRYFNPDTRGKTMEDNTLLALSCRYFQNKCIKMMVNRFSANVNIPDVGGFTPLILCAYHGNFAGVLFLLNQKVDLLAVGRLRSGPRLIAEHWAAIQGHLLIFRYLHALRRRSFLFAKKAARDQLASSASVASVSSASVTGTEPIVACDISSIELQLENNAALEPTRPHHINIYKRDAITQDAVASIGELSLPPIVSTSLGLLFSDEELNPEDSNWSALTAPETSTSLFGDVHIDMSAVSSMKRTNDVAAHSTSSTTVDNPFVSSGGGVVSVSSGTSNESSSSTAHMSAITPPPLEEHYCLCRRGYEGQMVGCDSGSCPVEWYHFECVGLLARPTGRWLCGLCTTGPGSHPHSCIGAKSTGRTARGTCSSSGVSEAEEEAADPFCVCGHEGVGQMVSCDNAHCLVEWYHFACVGLTAEPEGRWECPTCTEGRFHQPPLPLESAICPEIATLSSKRGRRAAVGSRGRGTCAGKREQSLVGSTNSRLNNIARDEGNGADIACVSEESPARSKRLRTSSKFDA